MEIRHELQSGWPGALQLCRRIAAYGRIDRHKASRVTLLAFAVRYEREGAMRIEEGAVTVCAEVCPPL